VNPAAPFSYKFSWEKRVLLIGGSEFRRSLRASLLRGHGLQVEVAHSLAEGRSLWKPNTYDWVLVDIHHQLPGEALAFCEHLKEADPRQQVAFLVGPPAYVLLNWPDEAIEVNKREKRSSKASNSCLAA
jgi:ActR/RegA family two-component response regulator